MTILAELPKNDNTIKVEVLDAYEVNGVKFAAVKACEGQPFVGGDKWPIKTEFATVPASELVNPNGKKPKKNLLAMALEQARDQWFETQVVFLVGDRFVKGAYLKASEGEVRLNLVGYGPSLKVYWLDLGTGEWKVARNLEGKYQAWARKAQEATK
jgi:hypothetical protein